MRNKLPLIGTFTVFLNSIVVAQAPYWKLNGNPNFGPDLVTATNNFLGTNTTNNIPIKIGTQGQQRIFIAQTNASGVPNSLGNVGIGNQFFGGVGGINPYSNLHIQQDNGNFNFGGGMRQWMSTIGTSTGNAANGWNSAGTGVMISNGDNIWLGLKNKGAFDLNDAILNWGDNGGTQTPYADYFRFNFTHYGTGFLGSTGDGLEIMRFAPTGKVGIGDFNITNIIKPQSKLHIHENGADHNSTSYGDSSVWFQMTNRDFAPNPTWSDGLRIGLLYQNANQRTGNAFIYNQENRHLIFSTNHATPDGNGAINNTLERMRITSIGAPTTLVGGNYGIFNPSGTNNTDFTRVAISINPSNPIQRPLSLLHLGYQATGVSFDGWRPWMDIGTFTNSHQGLSMYSGLKQSGSNDAVIGWGYTSSNQGFFATRMRFLFTTNSNNINTAGGANGIEAAHFWSDGNNTRMGVGDMQTAGVDPQNTLEIRSSANSPYTATNNASGLRFTNLTSTDAVVVPTAGNGINPAKVLTVDINGDVVLSTVNAGNSIGNYCSATQNILTNDYEVPLNGFNYRFTGQGDGSTSNSISVGYNCSINLPARVSVFEKFNSPTANNSIAGSFLNQDVALNIGQTFRGVEGKTTGIQTLPKIQNIGGDFYAANAPSNYGVIGISNESSITNGSSYGGYFETSGSNSATNNNVGVYGVAKGSSNKINRGAVGQASNSTYSNIGGEFSAVYTSSSVTNTGINSYCAGGKYNIGARLSGQGPQNPVNQTNIGAIIIGGSDGPLTNNLINYPTNINVGTYSYADCVNGPSNYAGYFQGNVLVSGTTFTSQLTFTPSDINVKKEVRSINSSLALIGKLKPVSFTYDNSYARQLDFGTGKNYGFIAQEVAEVFPELVKDMNVPATSDSLGNQVDPSVVLKSLNYTGLIPFAIGGIQELNQKQQEILKSLEKLGLSDAQVKTNVSSFSALTKIKQLSPVSYNFTNANVPQLSFGNSTDYGFVAQQLETVYPELVDTIRIAETLDSLGNIQNPSVLLKTVNYKAMSALLTRAVQEQQLTIDSLKQAQNSQDSINNSVQNQLAQLTALMNSCCQNTSARTLSNPTNTIIDVELSDKDIIVLNQNVPNPFAEQTTIAYNVPEKSGFAQIIFNDMKGQIIKVVDIKAKGKGQLNVFANDLSTGMYTYSLYVDGKLIDTKKMVKTE